MPSEPCLECGDIDDASEFNALVSPNGEERKPDIVSFIAPPSCLGSVVDVRVESLCREVKRDKSASKGDKC